MNTIMRLCLGSALCTLAGAASAAELKVVEVGYRDVSCVFQPSCVAVNPEIFNDIIDMPGITGVAQLRSETFAGLAGTPAEGKTGYRYQVDLTKATAVGDFACVTDMHVNFGATIPYRYNPSDTAGDVFVIAQKVAGKDIAGNAVPGTIGLESVVQTGELITFTFDPPVCTDSSGKGGQASAVFGLTGAKPPTGITVRVGMAGRDHVNVKAMVPTR